MKTMLAVVGGLALSLYMTAEDRRPRVIDLGHPHSSHRSNLGWGACL